MSIQAPLGTDRLQRAKDVLGITTLEANTPVTNAGAQGVVTAASYTAAKSAVDTATNIVHILGLGTFEATTESVTGASAGNPENANEHDGVFNLVFEVSTGVFKLFVRRNIFELGIKTYNSAAQNAAIMQAAIATGGRFYIHQAGDYQIGSITLNDVTNEFEFVIKPDVRILLDSAGEDWLTITNKFTRIICQGEITYTTLPTVKNAANSIIQVTGCDFEFSGKITGGAGKSIRTTTCTRVNVHHATITGNLDIAYQDIESTRINVSHCDLELGVSCTASKQGIFAHNYAYGNSLSGFRFNKNANGTCENITVRDNVFSDIGSARQAGNAAIMFGADGSVSPHKNIVIERNYAVTNIEHIGIGCDGHFLGLKISGNTMIKSVVSGECIALGGNPLSEDIEVSFNTLSGGTSGVLLYQSAKNAHVFSNQIRNCTDGIYFHGANSDFTFQKVFVYNNSVSNVGIGILFDIDTTSAVPWEDVHIGENYFYDITTLDERSGIQISDRGAVAMAQQVVDGVKRYGSNFRLYGDLQLLGDTNYLASVQGTGASIEQFPALNLYNSGASGGLLTSRFGTTANLGIPTQKFAGLKTIINQAFGNDARAYLVSSYSATSKDVVLTAVSSGGVSLLGFHENAPVAQGAAIANATDEADAVTKLNTLLAYLRTRGDIAT